MAERILPEPDSFATPPPADVAILKHYADTFQAVYISLNPFIDASRIGAEQFKLGVYPGRQLIAKNCRVVPWTEIIEQTGLPSIAAIDVGLRTSIHGLRPEFSNSDYAAKIETLAESSKILPPDEGRFPDLLHDLVLSAIQSLGYEWVWVGDEFGTERKLYLMVPASSTTSSYAPRRKALRIRSSVRMSPT